MVQLATYPFRLYWLCKQSERDSFIARFNNRKLGPVLVPNSKWRLMTIVPTQVATSVLVEILTDMGIKRLRFSRFGLKQTLDSAVLNYDHLLKKSSRTHKTKEYNRFDIAAQMDDSELYLFYFDHRNLDEDEEPFMSDKSTVYHMLQGINEYEDTSDRTIGSMVVYPTRDLGVEGFSKVVKAKAYCPIIHHTKAASQRKFGMPKTYRALRKTFNGYQDLLAAFKENKGIFGGWRIEVTVMVRGNVQDAMDLVFRGKLQLRSLKVVLCCMEF
jgi:hypothetical protein